MATEKVSVNFKLIENKVLTIAMGMAILIAVAFSLAITENVTSVLLGATADEIKLHMESLDEIVQRHGIDSVDETEVFMIENTAMIHATDAVYIAIFREANGTHTTVSRISNTDAFRDAFDLPDFTVALASYPDSYFYPIRIPGDTVSFVVHRIAGKAGADYLLVAGLSRAISKQSIPPIISVGLMVHIAIIIVLYALHVILISQGLLKTLVRRDDDPDTN